MYTLRGQQTPGHLQLPNSKPSCITLWPTEEEHSSPPKRLLFVFEKQQKNRPSSHWSAPRRDQTRTQNSPSPRRRHSPNLRCGYPPLPLHTHTRAHAHAHGLSHITHTPLSSQQSTSYPLPFSIIGLSASPQTHRSTSRPAIVRRTRPSNNPDRYARGTIPSSARRPGRRGSWSRRTPGP